MSVETLQDSWEVEAGGVVYCASFGELPDWIAEGSLLPGDKVRRGNLRWIEAGKVPNLVPFFSAKENGLPMPEIPALDNPDNVTIAEAADKATIGNNTAPLENSPKELVANHIIKAKPENTGFCSLHIERATAYICDSCKASFCKSCPKSYGGTVKICPECGSLCKEIGLIKQEISLDTNRSAAIAEGFGLRDLLNAFAYPFKFKISLLFGALIFMFFTLGQSASMIGGIYMFVAVIFCVMLANMLTFGVLANTVDNFSQGRLDLNFMPGFDDFSTWDDVIHPFFLSIGVYVSSFGPFILVLIIGMYLVFSSLGSQKATFENELKRVPGTQYYAPDRTMEQSSEVRKLIGNVSEQNEKRLAVQNEIASGNQSIQAINDNEEESDQAAKNIDESRSAQVESMVGKTSEAQSKDFKAIFAGFFNLPAPLVILGVIAFLWGIFYFPAACAVAGYTRSFMETINPTVGLDTIKRLGFTYIKLLAIGIVILVISFFIGAILQAIFLPFDLPGFGNLPAKAITSLFVFYFSVVFSCVIGYALFKSSDRLKLYT